MLAPARARSRTMLLAALLAGVLLGCTPSLPAPKYPFQDPRAALQLQSLARERVSSIRAEARVDQRGKDGRIKGTVLMMVERPDRVRVDAMTQFGPAAVLTSNGQTFSYADMRNKRFLSGPTCPKNIARLLNVPLSVQQTTLLLLGGTPMIEHTRQSIRWHEDGFYRIELGGGSSRQEIDLGIDEGGADLPPERQELLLLRSEIYDQKGRTEWRATYGEYKKLAFGTYKVPMPFKVQVEQPRAGGDTLIRFKEIELNVEIPDEAFTQATPPGMQEEALACD